MTKRSWSLIKLMGQSDSFQITLAMESIKIRSRLFPKSIFSLCKYPLFIDFNLAKMLFALFFFYPYWNSSCKWLNIKTKRNQCSKPNLPVEKGFIHMSTEAPLFLLIHLFSPIQKCRIVPSYEFITTPLSGALKIYFVSLLWWSTSLSWSFISVSVIKTVISWGPCISTKFLLPKRWHLE